MRTWCPVQFICRCWYFLRLHGHFRRKNKLGNNAKLALRADFWSARGLVLARGHPRRGSNNGENRKRGDLSDLMRGCRFRSACSASCAGEQRSGAAIDVALRSISSPTLLSSAREVEAGGEISNATLLVQQRRPILSPPLVCVAPGWKMPPGTQERRRCPGGTWLDCFAHVCLSPSGWSIPPNKKPRWAG